MITYPPAPWQLQGKALCTLQWVNSEKAALLVPKELEIISFWGKKTVGSVYLSLYGSGSTLEYSELIIAPAMVRYQGKIGAWISHIYVDNPQSLAGGKEMWGLPKEMANFSWSQGENLQQITVSQNEKMLICFTSQSSKRGLSTWGNVTLKGGCFGLVYPQFVYFTNQFQSKMKQVNSEFTIPQESPFAQLELNKPLFTVEMPNLKLTAGQPENISSLS